MDAIKRAHVWYTSPIIDSETKKAVAGILQDEELLLEAFGQELHFGTGGLRGRLGVGTNRMNIYTVAKATLGMAEYIKTKGGKKVAIAYDSRNGSREFAGIAAGVLAYNGIQAWVYDRLMPTPILSFTVRELHCDAGVVITASHNPSQYNGYKVYESDGCQITEEAAAAITAHIQQVDYCTLSWLTEAEAQAKGMLLPVPKEVYEKYIEKTLSYRVEKSGVKHPLRLVYTPLHGTGLVPMRDVFCRMLGIEVTEVEEQCVPDVNFPTCPIPNPELREALSLGIEFAKRGQSDLLIATDPDCDRVGVAVRQEDGDYQVLTGNEVGLLLMEYILSRWQKRTGEPPVVVKTIVTSDLAFQIARRYGAEVVEVLTGFKYIGETIGRMEVKGEAERFALGFEESCGYLVGSHVRDKDGVLACMLIAEMAQAYAAKGSTLAQAMEALYASYGYIGTRLLSFEIQGALPMEKMAAIMKKLRGNLPAALGNGSICSVQDYLMGIGDLPQSNMLSYQNLVGDKAIIRPSGTEPMMKVYLFAMGKNDRDVQITLDVMTEQIGIWLGMQRN